MKISKFKFLTTTWTHNSKSFILYGYVQTKTIVNTYFYLRPREDDHRLRSVFKFIHFGVRFRIYAFTVSVFIVLGRKA